LGEVIIIDNLVKRGMMLANWCYVYIVRKLLITGCFIVQWQWSHGTSYI